VFAIVILSAIGAMFKVRPGNSSLFPKTR